MYCCPKCFSDNFLQKHILVNKIKDGKCSFCNTENISLIKPERLFDLFESLLEMYLEDGKGIPLDELIQSDWDVFAIKNTSSRQELIKKISDNDDLFKIKYKPVYSKEKHNIEQWEIFREELKHKNRFFPKNGLKKEKLEPSAKYIGVKIGKASQNFYRARINSPGNTIDISEMGKPPEMMVSNGRANPIGIPYLYVASTIGTAIAEIRGHKGETVTVAKFGMIEDMELADLRNPKKTISPFELDVEEMELIYKNLPFLELLGKELSKPVIPREINLEYLPSQYLSELLKDIGFHGIIYRSSVSNGDNYVIFNDERLNAIEIYQYEITDVLTKSKEI